MTRSSPKSRLADSNVLALPPAVRLAGGLREFARAVRHIHDLNTFLEIFQVGLQRTGLCADVKFTPPSTEAHRDASAFASGRLSLPIVTERGIVAIGRVTPPVPKQHFGAEDLQVLSALSELLGAAVALAQQIDAKDRVLATLKGILNFCPVGVCVFDRHRKAVAVNTLARGWLALGEGDEVTGALPEGIAVPQLAAGVGFHLRVSGRLLYCETRPQHDGEYGALVVTDLTPEQGRLLDALGRELYRSNYLRRPLQFVLLERAQPIGTLLAAMGPIKTALGTAAIVGPYDAARIGVVFPECAWSTALPKLRKLVDVIAASDVRVGRAEPSTYSESPEALISNALEGSVPLASLLKPRILVHDEYHAVGDALRLVLGSECEVLGSGDANETGRLVREQHFDAVLADVSAAGGGEAIIAAARERNAQVQGFLLSSALPQAQSGRLHPGTDIPVFSKPFEVGRVRERILAAVRAAAADAQK